MKPMGPHSDFVFIFHFSIFVFNFLIFTSPFSFSAEISVFSFYFSVFVSNFYIFTDLFRLTCQFCFDFSIFVFFFIYCQFLFWLVNC